MNSATKHLDMVRLLLRQQRKDIATIKQSRYKRQGVYSIALTNSEKAEQIQSVQNQYKRRIGEVYAHMNAEFERGNMTMKSKIASLIEGFQQEVIILNDDIQNAVDKWRGFAVENEHNPMMYEKSLMKEIAGAREIAKKNVKRLNDELRKVVKDAGAGLFPDTGNKAADYATRVSNALVFLTAQLDTLTDESAFLILKDFTNDVDQMRLFKGIIESRHKTVGVNGESLFPKTFGTLNNAESILNTLNEIEEISESLFLHPLADGQNVLFGDVRIPLANVNYEEIDGEERILKLAADFEKMATNL